jgi:hypothetical protein
MTVHLPRPRAVLPSVVLAGVVFFAAGCGSEEGVKSYRVPKSTDRETKPEPARGDYRMLGAMFPADDPVWFFKFSGPADELAKFAADFEKIAASVKLAAGDKPPEFTLPDGWKRGGPRGDIVVETAKTPDGALELTVSRSKGGVQQNLSRWVGQIGLRPGPDDREKYTRPIDAAGGKGLLVDMKGPKNPATSRGPMMGGPR